MINFTNRQKDLPWLLLFLAVTTEGHGILGDDLVKGTVLAQGIMIPNAYAMTLLNKKYISSLKK